jgi:hypothetical protein
MKINNNYQLESVNIHLNQNDITLLKYLLKHRKEVVKLVTKKEKLLEAGNYGLLGLLDNIKKQLKKTKPDPIIKIIKL